MDRSTLGEVFKTDNSKVLFHPLIIVNVSNADNNYDKIKNWLLTNIYYHYWDKFSQGYSFVSSSFTNSVI